MDTLGHETGAAQLVLRQFALPWTPEVLVPLGNRGGFSGARIWRVQSRQGDFCLRAWPVSGPTPIQLRFIHELMMAARHQGLSFVPEVRTTLTKRTWAEYDDRLWDMTTWLPGRADFHQCPSATRLEAACQALARLHRVWADFTPRRGLCPALARRLDAYREWSNLLQGGWQPTFAEVDPVTPWAQRAWLCIIAQLPRIPALVLPWQGREVPLQPCLCDPWHDHVLFEGNQVTGLLDYGAVKLDHVTVDLARLLGSLAGDDKALRDRGIAAYSAIRALTTEESALVDTLDETGTIVAAANWLTWLYRDKRLYEDRAAVAHRLATIVERLEDRPAGSTLNIER